MGQLISHMEAQYYDIDLPDWPGEIDFYRSLVSEVEENNGSVLEVGSGTGRVTMQLALGGITTVGMELSPDMLTVARKKSEGLPNIHWVEGDMQAFDLDQTFDLILIPGHTFQFMLTPADQMACLGCIRRHLTPDGRLVIHVNHDDIGWLTDISQGKGSIFEMVGEYHNKPEGTIVLKWNAWSYESSTQTASAVTAWEIIGADGVLIERKETPAKHLHCFFRFEMEHLLARAGFKVDALYGDFYCQSFQDTSPDMIWVARLGST
jgi:SAM-dependent methyltransferase